MDKQSQHFFSRKTPNSNVNKNGLPKKKKNEKFEE